MQPIRITAESVQRPRFRVFVSSAIRGLEKPRRALFGSLDRMGIVEPWAWEHSVNAGPYSIRATCLSFVESSDALVLILVDGISELTREEYERALEAGVTTLIFHRPTEDLSQECVRLIQAARSNGQITIEFGNYNQLRTRVLSSIRHLLVQGWRSSRIELASYSVGDADTELLQLHPVASPTTLTSRLLLPAEIRPTVSTLSPQEAGEFVLSQMSSWSASGRPDVTLEIGRRLHSILESSSPATRAWALQEEGHALQLLHRIPEARAALRRMRAVSRSVPEILCVAHLNLSAIELVDARPAQALRSTQRAFHAAASAGDGFTAARTLLNAATAFLSVGATAVVEELVGMIEEIVPRGSAHIAGGVANLRGHLTVADGDHRAAMDHFRRSLALARRTGEPSRIVWASGNVGSCWMDLHEPGRAQEWYRKALEAAQQGVAVRDRAPIHGGMALAHLALNEFDLAAEQFDQAAALWSSIEDTERARGCQADALACRMEVETSVPSHLKPEIERLVDEFTSARDWEWLARVVSNACLTFYESDPDWVSGLVLRALKKVPDSAAAAVRDLTHNALLNSRSLAPVEPMRASWVARYLQAERLLGRPDWAWDASVLANALLNGASPRSAIPLLSSAIRSFSRRGDGSSVVAAMNDRALAYVYDGDESRAAAEFRRVEKAARKYEDRDGEVQALFNLAEVLRRRGGRHLEAAKDAAVRAVSQARKFRLPDQELVALGNLGLVYADQGAYDQAELIFRELDRKARKRRNEDAQANAAGGIAGIHFRRAEWAEALESYKLAVKLLSQSDDSHHLAEYLADVVLCISHGAGGRRTWETWTQRFFSHAHEHHHDALLVQVLSRAIPTLWERGWREEAGLSCTLAVLSAASVAARSNHFVEALGQQVGCIAGHAALLDEREMDELFALAVRALNEDVDSGGEPLTDFEELLATTRDVASHALRRREAG